MYHPRWARLFTYFAAEEPEDLSKKDSSKSEKKADSKNKGGRNKEEIRRLKEAETKTLVNNPNIPDNPFK